MKYNDMMEFTFGQWGDPQTMPLYGLGFKSVNIGKTQISGIELSLNGVGKIHQNLKINLIGGYTYMNPIALEPDKVYTESIGQISINGEVIGPEITYNNSSSDPSILKYRYQHIAKIDAELTYSDKYIVGSSVRYNDFMKNCIAGIKPDKIKIQEVEPGPFPFGNEEFDIVFSKDSIFSFLYIKGCIIPINLKLVFNASSTMFKYLFSKIFKGRKDPGKMITLSSGKIGMSNL